MTPPPEPSGTFKLVTVWLLIGTLVFLGFKLFGARQARPTFVDDSGTIELRRSADGHFHWSGTVNGVPTVFLVDTGATLTAVPTTLAAEAGMVLGATHRLSTANGDAEGRLSSADVVLDGPVRASRLRISVSPGLGTPLLGMNVLSQLQWTMDNGVMRIGAQRPADTR